MGLINTIRLRLLTWAVWRAKRRMLRPERLVRK